MTPDTRPPGIHAREPDAAREFTDRKTPTNAEWAQGVWDKFQTQPIGKKSERKRAINGLRRELSRAAITPEGLPTHLVHNPLGLEEAFSSWIARSDPNSERSRLFMETAQTECNEFTRKHWNQISGQELGKLVSATAHTTLAEGEMSGVLRSYFAGPGTPELKVEAMHKFADGALDLVPDKKALELAVRIGLFDTDIVPRAGEFHIDYDVFIGTAIDNLPMLEKGIVADSVFSSTNNILGTNKVDTAINRTALRASPQFLRKASQRIAEVDRAMPFDGMKKIKQLSAYSGSNGLIFQDGLTVNIPSPDDPLAWLFAISAASTEAVAEKFKNRVAPRSQTNLLLDALREMPNLPYQFGEVITVPVFDHSVIDICLPGDCTPEDVRLFAQVALEDAQSNEALLLEDREGEKEDFSRGSLKLGIKRVQLADKNLYYVTRRTTEYERTNRHELNDITMIGLPPPEDKQDLGAEISSIQDDIKKYQRRFLNRRGIRVGFYNPKITERGYSHIDVHKGNEPGTTRARLYHENKPYEIKLDKNLNLDLEGKTLIAPQFEESLHYYLLTILKDYFCKEALESSEGTIRDREGLIQARIPHLRFLPIGQRHSLEARKHYLDDEAKDLVAKSAERKILHGTESETTYVQAVVKEEDETLEPITVHIDSV